MATIARKPGSHRGPRSRGARDAGDEEPELLGPLARRDEGVGAPPHAVDERVGLDAQGHHREREDDPALELPEDAWVERRRQTSRMIVTGPSLTSSTSMWAPNRPVAPRPPGPQGGDDLLDHGLGDGRRRGRVPRRAAALAGVGVEGELADDEHGRASSTPSARREDAQLGDLARHRRDLLGPVVVGDADEREEAGRSMRPTTSPSTVTEARATRWRTALTWRSPAIPTATTAPTGSPWPSTGASSSGHSRRLTPRRRSTAARTTGRRALAAVGDLERRRRGRRAARPHRRTRHRPWRRARGAADQRGDVATRATEVLRVAAHRGGDGALRGARAGRGDRDRTPAPARSARSP